MNGSVPPELGARGRIHPTIQQRPKLHLPWLAKLQICTFDEAHILSEPGRGARLEGLLIKLHQINPFVQIIGLSATLSNAEEIAGWLGGEVLQHGVRPVPLETHFRKHKKDDQKLTLLFDILERGKDEGGQTLIFVASRRRAETLDEALREAGYRSRHHHSGLWPDDRLDAESRFRHGGLDVLVATSTLEMGVNLPARRVIVYDSFQFGESGPEPLSVQSFLQMIGRSGRPGLDTKGDAYLFSPKWVDDWEYRRGKPEKVFSRLTRPVSFAQFFLDGIDSGLAQSERDLKILYTQTLHAYQKAEVELDSTIELLIQEGFVERKEADELRVTLLGRITSRLALVPAEVVLLRRLIQTGAETPYDFVLAVCLWGSVSPRLWLNMEDLELVEEVLESMPAALLDASVDAFRVPRRTLLSAVKMLAILSSYGSPAELGKRFGVYPVEIARLRDRLPEVLMSVAQVVEPLGFADLRRSVQDAAAIVQSGLPLTAVSLMDLKGIGAVLGARLYESGFTPEILSTASPQAVAELKGISRDRAEELIAAAKNITPRNYHYTPQPITKQKRPWKHPVDLYRLRRSLDLVRKPGTAPGVRIVSGGSEERQVTRVKQTYSCTCPDYTEKLSINCKHILCVKRADADLVVARAIADLPNDADLGLRGGLHSLWQSANLKIR